MRTPGYYWVKNAGKWYVGQFIIPPTAPSGRWWIGSSSVALCDNHMDEIDERKITRRPPLWSRIKAIFVRPVLSITDKEIRDREDAKVIMKRPV